MMSGKKRKPGNVVYNNNDASKGTNESRGGPTGFWVITRKEQSSRWSAKHLT